MVVGHPRTWGSALETGARLPSAAVANLVSEDVELAAVEGDAGKLSEWLTTFQLVTVVLDPYTAESAWILETAGRFLMNFRDADCRVSLTVTADATDARKFLGPWADELLTFADPDRVLVKALDLKRLPALVHIRQDLTVVGASEGWDPAGLGGHRPQPRQGHVLEPPRAAPAGRPRPLRRHPAAG